MRAAAVFLAAVLPVLLLLHGAHGLTRFEMGVINITQNGVQNAPGLYAKLIQSVTEEVVSGLTDGTSDSGFTYDYNLQMYADGLTADWGDSTVNILSDASDVHTGGLYMSIPGMQLKFRMTGHFNVGWNCQHKWYFGPSICGSACHGLGSETTFAAQEPITANLWVNFNPSTYNITVLKQTSIDLHLDESEVQDTLFRVCPDTSHIVKEVIWMLYRTFGSHLEDVIQQKVNEAIYDNLVGLVLDPPPVNAYPGVNISYSATDMQFRAMDSVVTSVNGSIILTDFDPPILYDAPDSVIVSLPKTWEYNASLAEGLRIPTTIIDGIIWAGGVYEVFYLNETDMHVTDAVLEMFMNSSQPHVRMVSNNTFSAMIPSGLVLMQCVERNVSRCNTTTAETDPSCYAPLLNFSFVDLNVTMHAVYISPCNKTLKEDIPGIAFELAGWNLQNTTVHMTAPRMPEDSGVTKNIFGALLNHSQSQIQAFLFSHALSLPPEIAGYFPDPSMNVYNIPNTTVGWADLQSAVSKKGAPPCVGTSHDPVLPDSYQYTREYMRDWYGIDYGGGGGSDESEMRLEPYVYDAERDVQYSGGYVDIPGISDWSSGEGDGREDDDGSGASTIEMALFSSEVCSLNTTGEQVFFNTLTASGECEVLATAGMLDALHTGYIARRSVGNTTQSLDVLALGCLWTYNASSASNFTCTNCTAIFANVSLSGDAVEDCLPLPPWNASANLYSEPQPCTPPLGPKDFDGLLLYSGDVSTANISRLSTLPRWGFESASLVANTNGTCESITGSGAPYNAVNVTRKGLYEARLYCSSADCSDVNCTFVSDWNASATHWRLNSWAPFILGSAQNSSNDTQPVVYFLSETDRRYCPPPPPRNLLFIAVIPAAAVFAAIVLGVLVWRYGHRVRKLRFRDVIDGVWNGICSAMSAVRSLFMVPMLSKTVLPEYALHCAVCLAAIGVTVSYSGHTPFRLVTNDTMDYFGLNASYVHLGNMTQELDDWTDVIGDSQRTIAYVLVLSLLLSPFLARKPRNYCHTVQTVVIAALGVYYIVATMWYPYFLDIRIGVHLSNGTGGPLFGSVQLTQNLEHAFGYALTDLALGYFAPLFFYLPSVAIQSFVLSLCFVAVYKKWTFDSELGEKDIFETVSTYSSSGNAPLFSVAVADLMRLVGGVLSLTVWIVSFLPLLVMVHQFHVPVALWLAPAIQWIIFFVMVQWVVPHVVLYAETSSVVPALVCSGVHGCMLCITTAISLHSYGVASYNMPMATFLGFSSLLCAGLCALLSFYVFADMSVNDNMHVAESFHHLRTAPTVASASEWCTQYWKICRATIAWISGRYSPEASSDGDDETERGCWTSLKAVFRAGLSAIIAAIVRMCLDMGLLLVGGVVGIGFAVAFVPYFLVRWPSSQVYRFIARFALPVTEQSSMYESFDSLKTTGGRMLDIGRLRNRLFWQVISVTTGAIVYINGVYDQVVVTPEKELNDTLNELDLGITWTDNKDDQTMFQPALDLWVRMENISFVIETLAFSLLFFGFLISVIFGRRPTSFMYRFGWWMYRLVGPLMVAQSLLVVAPDYVGSLQLKDDFPCCGNQFTSMLLTFSGAGVGFVVSIALAVDATVLMLTIIPAILRALKIILQVHDPGSLDHPGVLVMAFRWVPLMAFPLSGFPLFILAAFSGDTLMRILILAHWILPVILAVVSTRSSEYISWNYIGFCMVYLGPMVALLGLKGAEFGYLSAQTVKSALLDREFYMLLMEILTEIAYCNVVFSDWIRFTLRKIEGVEWQWQWKRRSQGLLRRKGSMASDASVSERSRLLFDNYDSDNDLPESPFLQATSPAFAMAAASVPSAPRRSFCINDGESGSADAGDRTQ